MDKLLAAREQIDRIDREMAALFEERMHAVEGVAAYKKEHELAVFDEERERLVIEKNRAFVQDASCTEDYDAFIRAVMEIAKRRQRRLLFSGTVAYQGVEGAYSHIALRRLFPDAPNRSYQTWEEVFTAIVKGDAAKGVLPFENSYTGEVGEVLDLLYRYDVHITAIYDLKISHCLVGLRDAAFSDIRTVRSHPQALSQCQSWLKGRGYGQIPWLNTAAAAKSVRDEGDRSVAAIASAETAELYGLSVLATHLSTSAENTTRFIVVEKEQGTGGNRFNLMFTLDHTTGSLAAAMAVISRHGFNMECIRSQPLHNLPWQYYFYVELCGDADSAEAKQMLDELAAECRELKLLGRYEKREGDQNDNHGEA